MEISFGESVLGFLVDSKLTMIQQHALIAKKSNSLQGCIRRTAASRKVVLALSSVLNPVLQPTVQERHGDAQEQDQHRAMNMVKGLREVQLLSLEKRRPQGDLIHVY